MTRKELKEWANETVSHIFHKKPHSLTFWGRIGDYDPYKEKTPVEIEFHECPGYYSPVDMHILTYLPPLDLEFLPGDKVEITITKKA